PQKIPFSVADSNMYPGKSLRRLLGSALNRIVLGDIFRNTVVAWITVGMNNGSFIEQPFGQFRISFALEIRKMLHAKGSSTSVLRKIFSPFRFVAFNRFNSNKHRLLALITSS